MTITLHAPLVVPLEEVRLLAFECARRRIAKPADLPFGATDTQREAGLEKAFSWQRHTPRKRGPKTKVRIEAYLEEQAVAMAEFAKDAALIAAAAIAALVADAKAKIEANEASKPKMEGGAFTKKCVCPSIRLQPMWTRPRPALFLCLESTQLPF